QIGVWAQRGPGQPVLSPAHAASTGEEADTIKATLLVEANERLVLESIRAQVEAESAVQAFEEVSRRAEHDPLTQLPNRVLLLDRFEQAIVSAKRHSARLALLFLDLNEFKQINDTHGHATGDQVLKLVAKRLTSSVREADTVSRHGGDEFLVLLSEISNASDAALIADKVLAALEAPAKVGENVFLLCASIGISIYPDDGLKAEDLIERADAAMYRAKRQKNGCSHVAETQEHADTPAMPRVQSRHEAAMAEYEVQQERLLEDNRKLAAAVEDAKERLAAAEQSRRRQTEFMVILAHDLCTPLAPAHTTVEDLERIGADQPLLGQAQDNLDNQRVDMAKLIKEAVGACSPALEARQQHLSLQVPAHAPEVLGDPIRLAQALCNLLGNASKYTQMGGEISISVTVSEQSLEMTVSDNGRGIDARTLPGIFEPFVRGADAAELEDAGLGLGLTLVRQFVEAHGGRVSATSAGKGLGSQFLVSLPLAGADRPTAVPLHTV
ncbi:MAG TPA: diguanylate cyclase, partial [Lautropia sp.]|nr:diguanylate cyclase [Lautropia sp.]